MKKIVMAIAVMLFIGVAEATTLSVMNVVCRQRYPWNGMVDIDYEIVSDNADANCYVYPVGYDHDFSVSYSPRTLTGDGANGKSVKPGKHRMTWNMSADMKKNYSTTAFSMKMYAYTDAAPYLVIDLAEGSSATEYPVSYLSEIPEGGWTDEYKGDKMVFKLIPPGTFMMGSPKDEEGRRPHSYAGYETLHQVTITKPFYMGIFEVTARQVSLISGNTSSTATSAYSMSYNSIRGSTLGVKWPEHQQVDATSFLGKLRMKTGITIDLPTEAQWEYACRAGTSTAYSGAGCNTGNPNQWGLYYMNGSNAEWCLDWYSTDLGSSVVTDPKGNSSGTYRVVRGGGSYMVTNYSADTLNDRTLTSELYRSAYRSCLLYYDYLRRSSSNYSRTIEYSKPSSSAAFRLVCIPAQ